MKKKSFDHEFTQNVRKTFAEYNETPDEAAMAKFRSSLPVKGPTEIIPNSANGRARYLAAAALLIIFAMAGIVYLQQGLEQSVELTYSDSDTTIDELFVQTEPVPFDPADTAKNTITDEQTTAGVASESTVAERVDDGRIEDYSRTSSQNTAETMAAIAEAEQPEYSQISEGSRILAMEEDEKTEVKQNDESPAKLIFAATENIAPELPDDRLRAESTAEGKGALRRNRASVLLGSHQFYSPDQLTDGLGFSAGALREWRISDRFRFSTGGILAYNQFSLSSDIYANLPTQGGTGVSPDIGNGEISVQSTMSYTHLALEVPLQGIADIHRGRTGTISVGAGISSMLYLQETSQLESINISGSEYLPFPSPSPANDQIIRNHYLTYTGQLQTQSSSGSFDRLDAMRMVNISLMYEIRTSANPLMVEIYTKHPLGSLTSSEITFGMTGITLRYGIW
ncbi:MAG: hypothetical protein LAT67_07685 [Balneolales bacterium]|nr:hypothetical protein [Balneolales bacterium]